MLSECAIELSFKETIECILFTLTDVLTETSHCDTTSLIIKDLQVLISHHEILRSGSRAHLRQQISDLVIVDFGVTDTNCDGLFKFGARQIVHLVDSSWHNTSVLEFSLAT